jgi:uncharacterized SAM-binding protein YcdF (DUF218 family)
MRVTLYKLRRAAVWALSLYGLYLAIVLHTPFADYFILPLVVEPDIRPADAIVVMAAYATPQGVLNESGMWRSVEGARLYHRGLAPLVVVSGRSPSPGSGDPSAAIAAMLQELGVPREVTELERVSTNTHETALNIAKIAAERRWRRILLVTDAKHMRRALASFGRTGLSVSPAPSMSAEIWWGQPYDRYRKFLDGVHEYGGLLYYWWRGWT